MRDGRKLIFTRFPKEPCQGAFLRGRLFFFIDKIFLAIVPADARTSPQNVPDIPEKEFALSYA